MKRKKRTYRHFEKDERERMFAQWRAGATVAQLSEVLGREYNSVRVHLLSTGGFSPREPKPNPHQLTEADREAISRGVATGRSGSCCLSPPIGAGHARATAAPGIPPCACSVSAAPAIGSR